MQAPRLLRTLAARQISRRNAHHGAAYTDGLPVTTINDLPQPQGNWQTHYDAKQRKFNAQLAIGFGLLISSILFGKVAGFLEFHNDYPERPADIPSYK